MIWRDWLRHENMHHQLDAFAREYECNFESPPKDEMWFCNKRVPNPKVGMIMHHLCGQKIKVFYVSNNWQYFVESLRSRLCPNCNQGHWLVERHYG